MDRNRYRALFVEEARRRIGEGEAQLGAADGPRTVAFLVACHTLKGMCAQMGYERPHAVAHAMEDLCEAVRQDHVPVDDTLHGLLAEGLEAIAHDVAVIEAGGEPEGDTGLEDRMRAHLRMAGTTGFSMLREIEPEVFEEPASPRGDEAIGAIAELLAACRRVQELTRANPEVATEIQRMEAATRSIYTRLVELRQVAFDTLVPALRRQARGVAAEHDRIVELDVRGEGTQVDPTVLAALQGALAQLVTNAIVHGIEPPETRRRLGKPRVGRVGLSVERVGNKLVVVFSDDGSGFDETRLRELAGEPAGDAVAIAERPGVTTADALDGYAGRGQGLGAIRHAVEQLDGTLAISSEPGAGSRFQIDVPVHARPAEVLLVQAGGFTLGLPARALSTRAAPRANGGTPALLGLEVTGPEVVRLRSGGSRRVDRVIGSVEALVTPPPFPINRLPRVTGTTVGPDGNILFVVDPELPSPPPSGAQR